MNLKGLIHFVYPILLIVLGVTKLQAQEAIPASGGNASGYEGTVSYSVGQVFYITNSETSGSVAQGVQQAYEISVIDGIDFIKGINLSISAYPNPTTNFLILQVETSTPIHLLNYKLYDTSGKLLESKKITSYNTNIKMSQLPSSSYFLRVEENNKEIKVFKIIKNQ